MTMASIFAAVALFGACFLHVAERGRDPSCTIAIRPSATPVERYAAEELRDWTERLTGVRLPITDAAPTGACVRLSCADVPELGSDGFRLRTTDRDVEVVGGGRGVLYGVYELLETYGGIGWFTSYSTYVPKADVFRVPAGMDRSERPAFLMRDQYFYDVNRHADFAARMRINGSYGGWGLSDREGGVFGREAPIGNYSICSFVSPEKYGKSHPEYFALRGGRRVVAANPGRTMQACLTNPDVIEITVTNMLAKMRRYPKAVRFRLTPNDNSNFCTCPACAAADEEEGGHAGAYVRFVNAVADRVAGEFPDKLIQAFAYTYTRKPTKTRYRDNVLLELCSVEPDNAHPIVSAKCPSSQAFRSQVDGWTQQTKNVLVWSYVTDFNAFTTPFPNVLALQPDLQYYRDRGVRWVSPQGPYFGLGADLQELKSWLLAKWEWNPDIPLELLLDRFLNGHYGAAAPFVREYFDKLHALVAVDTGDRLGNYGNPCNTSLVTDGFLREAHELWKRAAAAVKGDPVRERAVRLVSFGTYVTRFSRLVGSPGPVKFTVRRKPPEESSDYRSLMSAAQYLAKMLKREPEIELCDGRASSKALKDRVFKIAAGESPLVVPFEPRTSIRLGPDEVGHYFGIDSSYGIVEPDATAESGKAVRLSNRSYEWVVHLPLPKLAFEEGCDYCLRVRMKVCKKTDAPVRAEAFACGVSDATGSGNAFSRSVSVGDAQDAAWAWYDVGTFKPAAGLKFWLSSGRFDAKKHAENPGVTSVAFDCLEITMNNKENQL